eukprot:8572365-Lingulodinium_polyedra.AAC.1
MAVQFSIARLAISSLKPLWAAFWMMAAMGARLCAVMASRAASIRTVIGPVPSRSLRPLLAPGLLCVRGLPTR